METIKEKPSVEEFLQFYPNLSLKFDYNEKDKLIKLFNIKNNIKRKRTSIILDEFQIQKLMKNQNKSDISSINIENKEILSIQKINNRDSINSNEKSLYRVYQQDEDIEKYVDKINEDFYLINKGIELQKRNLKRTVDVKRALELFFEKSELIQKVSKNYGIKNSTNPLKDTNIPEKIRDRIKKLISNLANNVLFEKFNKDKFIIKRNEIGKDCYFLLYGKASILKPVEYKYIKISYENYFKYLLNLRYNKEENLLEHVMNINWTFIKIYNEDNLIDIVKYYIQKRISVYSNISFDLSDKTVAEDLSLEHIEAYLFEYKLKFEDFDLSKEKILSDLNEIESKDNSDNKQQIINNYFKNIFHISKNQQMLMNSYDFIFSEKDDGKFKLVTLYKYEKFLIINPGAFFGDMSLDTENKKRNATVRTETDCIVASLSIEKYTDFLLDENKKIFMRHINFLCYNFFFNNISQKIFTKYYFPMFKLKNSLKDDVIYLQETDCNSVYFIIEGFIKYEINASVLEIHNLISFFISELKDSKALKLDKNYINNLKAKYLKNHNLIKMRNANIILIEKINEPQKFELNTSETYEILGLGEFFFEWPHICSSSVISQNARFFEITNSNLRNIISYEAGIKDDLHKLVLKKINVFLKRLYNIEDNFVKNIMSKIDSKFFEIYDTKFFNDMIYERENPLFKGANNEKNDTNKEGIFKKNVNKNEELLIMKKFSKNGYIDEKSIKTTCFSPLKLNKEIISPKLLSDLREKSINIFQENQKFNNKPNYEEFKQSMENNKRKENKNDNIMLPKKEHENNLINIIDENEQKKTNFNISQNTLISNQLNKDKISSNFNKSNIQSSMSNVSEKASFINFGKNSFSLPKLRKLIINTGRLSENMNLSIVKNHHHDNFSNYIKMSSSQQSMKLNEIDDIKNQDNTSDRFSLPGIKKQNSFLPLPIKRIFKRKINKNRHNKTNASETSIHPNKDRNILASYIKDYYHKRKIQGYLAIINPVNNSFIKKKLNNNFFRLLKK